jgi:endoglucanase
MGQTRRSLAALVTLTLVGAVACTDGTITHGGVGDGAVLADGGASDGGRTDGGAGDDAAVDDDAAADDAGGGDDAGQTDGGGTTTFYGGVNLSVAEFGAGNIPGTYGTDYIYPSSGEVDYYVGKGMTIIRLPFLWERLQRTLGGPLDTTERGYLDAFVTYATGKGARVILDPHNYARYNGQVIGGGVTSAQFADLWAKLAQRYGPNPLVVFGLMNEPHDLDINAWLAAANAAIQAIRDAGATNLILVPGSSWTGAHSWVSSGNGTTMLGIVDPGNNYGFEVHQYLDSDSSGTSETCVSTTIGAERLQAFTEWARAHATRGFLGEFAGARNQTCDDAVSGMLDFIDANRDVWLGWSWWAGGPWWGDYMFTLEPSGGVDRPQLALLVPHL